MLSFLATTLPPKHTSNNNHNLHPPPPPMSTTPELTKVPPPHSAHTIVFGQNSIGLLRQCSSFVIWQPWLPVATNTKQSPQPVRRTILKPELLLLEGKRKAIFLCSCLLFYRSLIKRTGKMSGNVPAVLSDIGWDTRYSVPELHAENKILLEEVS